MRSPRQLVWGIRLPGALCWSLLALVSLPSVNPTYTKRLIVFWVGLLTSLLDSRFRERCTYYGFLMVSLVARRVARVSVVRDRRKAAFWFVNVSSAPIIEAYSLFFFFFFGFSEQRQYVRCLKLGCRCGNALRSLAADAVRSGHHFSRTRRAVGADYLENVRHLTHEPRSTLYRIFQLYRRGLAAMTTFELPTPFSRRPLR